MKEEFTRILMKWHRLHNKRQMPWKGEKDPYKIWLSEVILQQTRVEQGMSYYNNFISHYPTVFHLAKAKDQEVYKLWEGLGYYNRCSNLLFTARQVVTTRQGRFPDQYDQLLTLKGVGPYTAAAIASFAYNQPYAVVDGNVFRVLSRFFGIDAAIDSAKGKPVFMQLAQEVLDKKAAGAYNQGIMDFGATICKPLLPLCAKCPLQLCCNAHQQSRVHGLPVKEKTLQRRRRWFYFFVFEYRGRIMVQQRLMKDIWQNLFEFYLLETEKALVWNETSIDAWLAEQWGITKDGLVSISPVMQQQLTHQQIRGQFVHLTLNSLPPLLKKAIWQPKDRLQELPFPRLITQYLALFQRS